jgi:DNA polymerase-3 subunit beta
MKIAFNARFLAEMLGILDSDEVQMEFSSPSRAGILTPVEENSNDRDILMLVMPVMLNN